MAPLQTGHFRVPRHMVPWAELARSKTFGMFLLAKKGHPGWKGVIWPKLVIYGTVTILQDPQSQVIGVCASPWPCWVLSSLTTPTIRACDRGSWWGTTPILSIPSLAVVAPLCEGVTCQSEQRDHVGSRKPFRWALMKADMIDLALAPGYFASFCMLNSRCRMTCAFVGTCRYSEYTACDRRAREGGYGRWQWPLEQEEDIFQESQPWESRCWCTTYHDIQIYILDFIVYKDMAWVLYRPTYKMLLCGHIIYGIMFYTSSHFIPYQNGLVQLSQTTRSQHIQFHLPIDWRILGQNLHAGLHWSQKGYSWFWELYDSNIMDMVNCYSIGEKVANSYISICMYVCTVSNFK